MGRKRREEKGNSVRNKRKGNRLVRNRVKSKRKTEREGGGK